MPRHARAIVGGETYHVVNRGNDRRTIFTQAADYKRFLELLESGRERAEVKIFGYCLMPSHFHLLAQPQTDDALSAYMHWVGTCYACDLRAGTQTLGHGHVFQRRYWSCPVQDPSYFMTALRYIEANPLRAGLVRQADEWRWSSLAERPDGKSTLLSPLPFELPPDWDQLVNLPQEPLILRAIRRELRGGTGSAEPVPASAITAPPPQP